MPEVSRFLGIVIAMYFKEHCATPFPCQVRGPKSRLLYQRPEVD